MSLSIVFVIGLFVIVMGYFFYGSYVSRIFSIDDNNKTPAHSLKDDQEFIPTRPFYLFCQHFSAIAASGPIVGPILACQKWGWFFPMAWIVVGVVLIGSVHDFGILCASVRSNASSIVEIAKNTLGKRSGTTLLWFIWLSLIYIIIAFIEVTAATFVSASEELQSLEQVHFNPGGAVLASAIFYLILCLILGLFNKYLKLGTWPSGAIFIPATFFAIYIGVNISYWFVFDQKILSLAIIFYCGIASLLPIWLLLQPRGFLGGFILLMVIIVGILGALMGGFDIKQPAFLSSDANNIFPFLFVTIACGACSGFHGLVCGGTTAKQIDKESHIKPIAYGAMLCEGIVALIALSTIMIFSNDDIAGLKPGTIYGKGIGEYLVLIAGEENRLYLTTFGAMAFSTFVFDTLDVATRIGRYLIEEMFSLKSFRGKILSVIMTLFIPFIVILMAKSDFWISFWILFGSANQLLAALGLFTLSIWLKNNSRRFFITLLPMIFILSTTFVSMIKLLYQNITKEEGIIPMANGLVTIALLILAMGVMLSFFYNKKAILIKS